MAKESSPANALANAEMERRGIRRVLYFVSLFGVVATFFPHPATQVAGPIVAAVALAGLAASCRPIAG